MTFRQKMWARYEVFSAKKSAGSAAHKIDSSAPADMTMTHETRPPTPPPIDRVSDSADDGRMEKRIEKLESSLAAIELDLGILKATCATKSDLAEAKTTIILWVVTAIILAQILPGLLKKFGLM